MELLRLNPGMWIAVVMAASISLIITPLVILLARRIDAMDHPEDDRRIHSVSTPRMGGVGMCVAVVITASVLVDWSAARGIGRANIEQIAALLACAIAVTLLGAADDWRGLQWRSKLLGQMGIALVAVFAPLAGHASSLDELVLPVRVIDPPLAHAIMIPAWLGVALAVLWMVALMNMLNFVDGVDGLAAGIGVITAATFAIIAASYSRGNIAVLAGAVSGSALGFLRHNFRKGGARIFMGDAGSMLLGFLLAAISLQGVLKTAAAVSLVTPLALLAIPIFDTLFVVAKRVRHGQPVAAADKWHLHHRLLNVGYTPRRVTMAFWLWTASLSSLALALRFVNYGNSHAWRVQGLVVLFGFVSLAIVLTIFLLVTLEIVKTPAVRARNASIAAGNRPDAAG